MNYKYRRIGFNVSMLTLIGILLFSTLEQKNPYYLVWTWAAIALLGVFTLVSNDQC